ncbi:FRAS1-related extracellular matrix protein 2 isoform X2 [Choloepus didactylus]|uniref:FRAS1-related extracellular matrix protein 2 isoform X2 n=1 Tax=Choloepus didactylus TaxID=27675 RepID=UPI0018A0F553|nr:FRAS1-related extracellular matrix protein 2 isoform X2 [Choloepus didactylus]
MSAAGTSGNAARARRAANPANPQPMPLSPPRWLLLLLLLSPVSRVPAQPAVPGLPLLSPGLAGTAGGPSEDAVVLANRGLRVPFGREVWLDPLRDLVLQVQPGDRCTVTVLDNDALAQRPGRLRPQRFPCDFGPGEVRYSHLGARSPSRDRVRLQLRYDAPAGTVVLPLVLEVEVAFTQLEVVIRNLPLVVEELLGTSSALDGRSLEFAYQPEAEECRVGILSSVRALPRYGELLHYPQVPGPAGEGPAPEPLLMDCKAFLELGVRYRHTARSRSPNRDWVPMVVEVHPRGAPVGSPALKREHFQVLVRIRGGTENTAPKPSFVAMMMMEVAQFVLTALTPDMLAAEDAESAPDLLVFNLTSPFQPGQGCLVSTDDRSLPLSSFTQKDLRLLKIAYQPPAEDSDQERLFELELEVVDPEGAASDPFAFMVVVKPMNTLAPVVTRNTGLVLYEGQSRPLSGPAGSTSQSLVISDEDDLEAVRLEVVAGLRHGHLLLLGTPDGPSAPKTFTAAQLAAGQVVYQHDARDGSLSDNLVLRMVDGGGRHQVQFLLPITLVPVDDQPPVLNANTGLAMAEGETAPILPPALSAADVDSDDALLLFVLEPPYSAAGHLLLRQTQPPREEEELGSTPWRKQGAFYERTVTEWQQRDIAEGRLFYRHLGSHSPGPVTDQFTFRVQDDHDPPNRSGPQRFVIRVHPVDRLPPEPGSGCPLRMVVRESQLTPLRRKWLRYTDLDTEDRELRYTVTQPPVDTDENHPPAPLGALVLADNPSVVVTHFTQAQVNHHKIAYQPPDEELGVASRVAQFRFRVEDRAGNTAPGTFTLYLQPVDNQPPEILNTGFTVGEKGQHTLSETELHATDVDTDAGHISFTLIQAPQHGHLRVSGQRLHVGGLFRLEDIRQGRVSYAHSGGMSRTDSCSLEVSDTHHVVPITLRVSVRPADDEGPRLQLPAGTLGSYLDVLENGATEITAGVLRGPDEGSDDLMLTFVLEDAPSHGEILVSGVPAVQFTQKDVLQGSVVYAHTSGEIGLLPVRDAFNLSLSEMSQEWRLGGRAVQSVTVWVTILPVNSQAPEVSVGEPFTVLEGEKGVITSAHLSAEDVDSPTGDILCIIVTQPASGYVENVSPAPGSEKSRAGIAVSALSLKDLRQGHVHYVQSVHRGVEPVEDRFVFRCSDGVHFSERHFFPIVIVPTNDEQPAMFLREFVVMEGRSLVIDTPILNAADADVPPDDLTFTITRFPSHGHVLQQLINGTALVGSFTWDQIVESSSIIYEHDDSEMREDSFAIRLTDGKHSVEKVVPIVVIPVDDETPRMTINNGLEIEIGETKTVNSRVLMATDLDSEDKSLVYIVRYGPSHGLLQRQTPTGAMENITLGRNFTQDEVDRNLIQYVHLGREGARDLIKFDVTDGINALIDRYFYVSIDGVDTVFPDVVSKGVSLKEGGKATLTTDLLSTSDLNSPDENLVFTITRNPARGHLECTDRAGVAITSFTQLQLAGSKIYYIHTADDEVKMDSFEFQVTDGRNPVFRTFRISISDVDNKKPVVTIHSLVVSESENKLITPFELSVEDRDTPDELLTFTVTRAPVRGHLLFNNSRPVTAFTKQDLNNNLISYRHDGSVSSEDSFSFTVTDGTHADFYVFPDTVLETRRPQVMKIRVLAVDSRAPQVAVNRGASWLRTLPTGHLGFVITSKALRVEDGDSLSSPRFTVTAPPRHGHLLNLGEGNHSVTQFTQADIDDMKICYVLREGANATSDGFHFTVEDSGGNKLTNQQFHLNWAWISFEKEYYLVNEDSKFLDIVLKRRGYLGETSFISIGTRDGTAERDKDFRGKAQRQVQFNPGQSRATWRVRIVDDGAFERSESFQVLLWEPVLAALEAPAAATVEIVDPGDESTVFIPQSVFSVEEDVGELLVPVRRSGDASQELMVICHTQPGTAAGTVPTSVLSFSDYISRPEDHTSVVRFDRGQRESTCRVVIIDDSLHEEAETFCVLLSAPMGGRLGPEFPAAQVTIVPDRDDEPTFFFGGAEFSVDESAGSVEVHVWRSGTDLSRRSSVTVRSRKAEPPSADAGTDYVGISQNLDFAPGVNVQTVRVSILDDLGQPVLEGVEKFELVLRMPVNAALREPSKATVSINDSASDLPKMQFKEREYTGNEDDGQVTATIRRTGDTQYGSSVRCYTRQASAQVMADFRERSNTDLSVVTFLPGETEKPCVLELVDDELYEEGEELRLVLGSPQGSSPFGAAVGEQNETLIRIRDDADRPVIKFGETKFSVREPKEPGQSVVIRIPVIRQGDTSKASVVRVHTKDGSATSGEDYLPVSEEIEFKEGERQHVVEIDVVFDGLGEMREVFSVHLAPDDSTVADTQVTKAVVYIEEADSMADVTFPSVPEVVSLLMYDDISRAKAGAGPVPGYPVVCITACNPRHSGYGKTGAICASERIDDTLSRFRWLVSAPTGPDGVSSPLREVDFDTFFTSSKAMALDSIYFQPGSRVQCAARAVTAGGNEGLELLSPVVTVSREGGLCHPRVPGAVGAEPFSARLRYTGPEDAEHANLVKLTVAMPHIDGMLPVVSTRELSNFELTLSPDGTRVGHHRCSNLLDYTEVPTRHGFLTNATGSPGTAGETHPHQHSSVRGASALRFYRNLHLEACLWEFVSYYDMSELLADCGGTIRTDGQVLNLVQSYVTLRLPLFVSYVFHSPVGAGGWQHFDLKSELRLTFVYDTAVLWHEGVGSPPGAELQGSLHPTSMRISDEGRLVVNFKTQARFHGVFVLSHPASPRSSAVVSADHPDLTFSLRLLRSEPTYSQPEQQWSFVSDFAVRDYSGSYLIKLLPCTVPSSQGYRLPVSCSPREPLTFDLDIRFQQVSDPVATEFSLNTQMYLLSKKSLWLSDGSMGFGQESDAAFAEGDVIYGRVMVDPVQSLGDAFLCSIEKVFLCTGADGYVPKYRPEGAEYGCLADSPTLLHRFKIVDKAQPETQATSFGNILFNAQLAVDDPEAVLLVNQPGSDGFRVDSAPLFQLTQCWSAQGPPPALTPAGGRRRGRPRWPAPETRPASGRVSR